VQYVRGIEEGNGTPPGGDLWVTYSSNKEDIFVSRVPVPVRYSATGAVNDTFDAIPLGGAIPNWNIYTTLWAPVRIAAFPSAANKSLELSDRDPHDYARAVRVFEESKTAALSFKVYPKQADAGRLEIEVMDRFGSRPVRLLDATVVREPGKTGSEWRIHYSLRLPTLECDHFDLTSTRGAGTGERFGRFSFHAGELVLADAGYCHPAGVAAVVAAKADLCVRLSPYGMPLYDEQGKPFPLLKRLGRLKRAGDFMGWPVWIQSGDARIAGRVCAIRKSQDAIEKAQRRLTLRRQAGKKVGPTTRRYAEYVLVFTTLPAAEASAEQVLEAYRLRWQIELTFKRLKSIAQLGHLPKRDDRSSRAWLYGKLFVALLSQKLVTVGKTISPWGYLLPQTPYAKPMA